jgi:hypothetical protein
MIKRNDLYKVKPEPLQYVDGACSGLEFVENFIFAACPGV